MKYYFIIFIWLSALFLRCYRQSVLLGFYYDQGRDAFIARDIITTKNFPTIGPTTGIQGLHLGPFWYYLITPGYLFGQGSPVIASYFIAFIESLTVPLIFMTLSRYWSIPSAVFTSTLWAFSYYIIRSARWFSNPSPLPFFVILMIFFLAKIIIDKKTKFFPYLVLLFGLSLQLEAASAIFFFPSIAIILFLHRPILKRIKFQQYVFAVGLFLLLLVPQLLFDLKNKFLILGNFLKFFTGNLNTIHGQSWAIPNKQFLLQRLVEYYRIFFSKLDTNLTPIAIILLCLFVISLIFTISKYRHRPFLQIILAWLFVPLALLLFFIGNYGRLYDYYLTGFFVSFFILFGISLTSIPVLPIIVFVLFIKGNFVFIRNYLSANPDGPQHISLGNQLQALKHVCQITGNQPYLLNIYLPAIVPTTYDYLLAWLNSQGYCQLPLPTDDHQNPYIFSLYEVDQDHPERIEKWLDAQNVVYPVISQTHFGGIVVQQRSRPK